MKIMCFSYSSSHCCCFMEKDPYTVWPRVAISNCNYSFLSHFTTFKVSSCQGGAVDVKSFKMGVAKHSLYYWEFD